jgi:hypothetical protein
MALMMAISCVPLPAQGISRKVSPNDSLTLTFKLSKEESVTQTQLNTLLTNSVNTNTVLSASIEKLTDAIEQGIAQGKQTKADIVSTQLGISKETLNKEFKRNNTFILISLLPCLIFVFWAMGSFLLQKGLDIKSLLLGTAVMALYSFIGAGVLYAVLSLVFNSQYFVAKNLMSAIF